MNERIKELVVQAGFSETYGLQEKERLSKFAELIVRECAMIAIQESADYSYPNDVASYVNAGKVNASKMIKKHFGVKELGE